MLEDTWHIDFSRRSDMSDTFYPNVNGGLPMWESYPIFSTKPKKEEKGGLAEAITNCILSTGIFFSFSFHLYKFEACLTIQCRVTGRIDIQRKLFCSIQLVSFTCWVWCIIVLILHVDRKELTHLFGIDWRGGFDKWFSCSSWRKVCSNFHRPYHVNLPDYKLIGWCLQW